MRATRRQRAGSGCHDGRCRVKVRKLGKKSGQLFEQRGTVNRGQPKKFSTARPRSLSRYPAVKPRITDSGMKRIIRELGQSSSTSIAPARSVTSCRPARPCSAVTLDRRTANAPWDRRSEREYRRTA